MPEWGAWSLAPLAVTLLFAFATRSALVAMLSGTFVGTLMLDAVPGVAFNDLLQRALGNGDFIWICQIVLLIGILFELFRRAGVLYALSQRLASGSATRRRVELSTFGMGFAIVDDYFSPLLTGSIMRPLSDRAMVPREKLAFILDSTTASVCILVPFTAWGAYMASLIAAQVPGAPTAAEALAVFIAAIPYNFYPLLLLSFTLLVCAGLLPDFGPMRRAENRVLTSGALLRKGAKPLSGAEESLAPPTRKARPMLVLELVVPVLLLIGIGVSTLLASGSVRIVEAFMLAVTYLFCVFAVRGDFASVSDAGDVIVKGARGVVEALLIIALAYALNAVTGELQAAQYIIERFAAYLTPATVVALTFLLTATISFATGTSWGAFALMMPVALPLALDFSDGEVTTLVLKTIAAVAGGGIFGDHASPVSDTSVLSSVGAGSDHMDHVVTQLPYALVIALLTLAIYLFG